MKCILNRRCTWFDNSPYISVIAYAWGIVFTLQERKQTLKFSPICPPPPQEKESASAVFRLRFTTQAGVVNPFTCT